MSEARPELQRHLLAMLGGTSPPPLSAEAWAAIGDMAGQHRLRPVLAWRLGQAGGAWPVPPVVGADWRQARHASGLANLALHSALRLASARLTAAAIPFAALKGPRLAWRCYPEPGLRPMRDLDLLVAERDILCAAAVLAEAGFAMTAHGAAIAEALADHKHLPPLRHAGLGATIELHHRVSDPPGVHGYKVPQLDPAAFLARAEPIALGGIEVPCSSATDLLAHLVNHALYGHLLDCGPLVLADIDALLASEPIAGAPFWRAAEAGGWARGAALLLALTEHYFGPQPLARPAIRVSASVLAAAEQALLQNLDASEHTNALADLLAARSPGVFARSLATRLRPAPHVVEEEGGGAPLWRFWPAWAVRRIARFTGRLFDRRAAGEARRGATLLRWLDH
ncbi:MAG: nucleotidyltransferase family protein [Croceibacterium sp.]